MEIVSFHKVTALPGPDDRQPNSIYLVAVEGEAEDYLEVYVTGLTGNIVRSTLTRTQIRTMVAAMIAEAMLDNGMRPIDLIEASTIINATSIIKGAD